MSDNAWFALVWIIAIVAYYAYRIVEVRSRR